MMGDSKIKSALISVFNRDGLLPIVQKLGELDIRMYATGGTQAFIAERGFPVTAIEDVTGFPAILGGRVKTLHPKVFGGILHRRDHEADGEERRRHHIPSFDLVIIDLYPFEEAVRAGAAESDVIEKIDIGGISLIRAAAKNHKDVLVVSASAHYEALLNLLENGRGMTSPADRYLFAARAFATSSHYDTAIFNYFNRDSALPAYRVSVNGRKSLRYGENPHQKGDFFGDFEALFHQLHGKDISYNNLTDIEAGVQLMAEFDDPCAFAIIKHNNACGLGTADSPAGAYQKALSADPLSAFGGVLVCNRPVDEACAREMDSLFFEIAVAPAFSENALEVLKRKKNRILLVQHKTQQPVTHHRSLLNGMAVQQYDRKTDAREDMRVMTRTRPSEAQISDLIFASKICKHAKSNAIVLAKDQQLLAAGVGQTSRVDALRQAIEKARRAGFSLNNASMASDAFFPFPDCVEIAHTAGITSIIQPGGSIKDQLSIDYCDTHKLAMVFTGFRHFKH